MKLTKEQISEIQKLRSEGMNVLDLSKKFNTTLRTIRYWTGYRERSLELQKEYEKNLTPEKKKLKYEKGKEYRKNYFKERYANDPEFRNKHIERVKKRNNQGIKN